MIKLFCLVIAVLMFTACSTVAFGQAYQWQPLSPNDAIQAVRSFEKNPSLNVTVTALPEVVSTMPDPASWYELTAGNYDYIVNLYTSDSFVRTDHTFSSVSSFDNTQFYGQSYNSTTLGSQAMSQSAAQAIAQTFMQTHYPVPALLNATTCAANSGSQSTSADSAFIQSYKFNFYQDCGGGVVGPSNCTVEVDTIMGQVVSYYSNHFPLLISTNPILSGNQAMASAMNSLQRSNGIPISVINLSVAGPDAMGAEQLVYSVSFYGIQPGNASAENYLASVDASSGQLLSWAVNHGIARKPAKPASVEFNMLRLKMAKKSAPLQKRIKLIWGNIEANLNYPPLLVANCPYVYANYLCYNSSESKINVTNVTKGKQVIVSGPGRYANLRLKSQTYQVNGQTKQMSAKPLLINGRCYVPLDVMQAVLGGKWSYEAKAQTVRYDPPQVKQASK